MLERARVHLDRAYYGYYGFEATRKRLGDLGAWMP